jgi:hypothetical protein
MAKRKLKNDDYLVGVTVRVAVRNKDAAAVIALNKNPFQDDETEGTRF